MGQVEKVINFAKCVGKGYNKAFHFKGRYRCFKGARNTKKSFVAIVYDCLLAILTDERNNALIIREVCASHRTTTFATFKKIINRPVYNDNTISLRDEFRINNTLMTITRKSTGQVIYFLGMDDPEKIQGIQVESGYLTRVYVDEAYQLKAVEDWNKVDGSIRGDLPEGMYFQITFCFNAWNKKTWLYDVFFKGRLEDDYQELETCEKGFIDYCNPDEHILFGRGLYLHISTYRINEFRDKVNYDAAMEHQKEVANDIYRVNALGMWGNTTGATYPHFSEKTIITEQEALNYSYADYCIGIDTGLSDGQGKIKYDKDMRFKSATTMVLKGMTSDYNKIISIDEYFISNQNREVPYTEPQIIELFAEKIIEWIKEYQIHPRIMKGQIKIYVDCADLGFRQGLDLELRKRGVLNAYLQGSTKKRIEIRVQFTNLLMAYGDFQICDKCKNLIRETKNSQKGENGQPREDFDDHTINADEYASAPFYPSINAWKTFKKDI